MTNEKQLIDVKPLMKNGWHLVRTGESNRFLQSMSLADVPTVDAVEVVHGHWTHDQVEGSNPFIDSPPIWFDVMQCSVCKEYIEGSHGTNYCPNCGAKMDGDVHE